MGGIVTGTVSVSHDPHEALVIHRDRLLVRRPLVARTALPAPALYEVALVVEFHHGRRGQGSLSIRECVRAAKNPHVVVGIDCDG